MLTLALALEKASSEALDMLLLRTSVIVEEGSKQHAQGRAGCHYVIVSAMFLCRAILEFEYPFFFLGATVHTGGSVRNPLGEGGWG